MNLVVCAFVHQTHQTFHIDNELLMTSFNNPAAKAEIALDPFLPNSPLYV